METCAGESWSPALEVSLELVPREFRFEAEAASHGADRPGAPIQCGDCGVDVPEDTFADQTQSRSIGTAWTFSEARMVARGSMIPHLFSKCRRQSDKPPDRSFEEI